MLLDRSEEWKQIFEEAWRYEKDYFYDPECMAETGMKFMNGMPPDTLHQAPC